MLAMLLGRLMSNPPIPPALPEEAMGLSRRRHLSVLHRRLGFINAERQNILESIALMEKHLQLSPFRTELVSCRNEE